MQCIICTCLICIHIYPTHRLPVSQFYSGVVVLLNSFLVAWQCSRIQLAGIQLLYAVLAMARMKGTLVYAALLLLFLLNCADAGISMSRNFVEYNY